MTHRNTPLNTDRRLLQVYKNLRAMNLKYYIDPMSDDEILITIQLDSIMNLIDSKMTHSPRELALIDDNAKPVNGYLAIHFWRVGTKPKINLIQSNNQSNEKVDSK